MLYTHLHGNHYYYALPFVLIGMEELINNISSQRKTWYDHSVKAWLHGTSNDHYCCWRLWMQRTRATRISGIVFSKHKYISNPTVTAADAVMAAAQNMADALKTRMNRHLGKKSLTTLYNLQKSFAHAAANKKIRQESGTTHA